MQGPLIVVLGPTASGKTKLAVELALRHNGEIICADSRTIYAGMDIGTAKPTLQERQGIPHYGLDLVTPDQSFSAAQFQQYAYQIIAEVQARGNVPILVGGSGMYIDGVVYGFDFAGAQVDDSYDQLDLSELQIMATDRGLQPSEQVLQNKRHLIGFLRRGGAQGVRTDLPEGVLMLGLASERSVLQGRIEQRIAGMLDGGLLTEVERLTRDYPASVPGLAAPAYQAYLPYLAGTVDLVTATADFARADKQLAKRQMTWFKRNKDIQWIGDNASADKLVQTFLLGFATIDT